MEAARSLPFYDTTTLYSLGNVFNEKAFKYEVWLCHEHMKMGFDEIFNTSVSDRKDYIRIHNKIMSEQKAKSGGA